MKKDWTQVVVLILGLSFNAFAQNKFEWNFERAKKHAEAQQDTAQWELNLLKVDGAMSRNSYYPIQIGSFPVAKYDSPGNGNSQLAYKIGNSMLSGQAVFVGKGEQNKAFFTNNTQVVEVPFVILSVVDSVNHGSAFMTSRNHPHYLAEGRIPFKNYDIDWVSMQMADRNAYAIVNMRLFDLRFGRLVIVAPQKDGSMRFLQVMTGDIFASGDRLEFINDLSQKVKSFLETQQVKQFIQK